MPSPFAFPQVFQQSVLTFEVGTGLAVVDARGNKKAGSRAVVTLQAYFKSPRPDLVTRQNLGGLDAGELASTTLDGYLTNPMTMPSSLLPGTKGEGVVNGQHGKVLLLPSIPSSLPTVRSVLGDRIRVRFTQGVRWGEVD